ncbi:30S ribosomal protein S6e [archaeon]|nr:30S ribosomal protein S6e [archaeon]
MAEFKLNINDPKTGKSYSKTVEGTETDVFKGKKLKDKIPGDSLGLKGYELEISGGSDRQGFPMRWDISGTGRKKPLLVEGVGVRNKGSGIKQRKSIRGNAIDLNIKQINLKIIKAGTTSLKELGFLTKTESEEAKKEEALKEAAAKEAPKEEVKEESTPEEKNESKEE